MTGISRITTDNPQVYAFMIRGEVTTEDMEGMARLMNAAFDAADDVSMLLIFAHFDGREMGAGLNPEAMRAQFRSLAHVSKYAVVAAPEAAATMIAVMNKIIPVDARSFDAAQEAEAWAFVGARPIPAGAA